MPKQRRKCSSMPLKLLLSAVLPPLFSVVSSISGNRFGLCICPSAARAASETTGSLSGKTPTLSEIHEYATADSTSTRQTELSCSIVSTLPMPMPAKLSQPVGVTKTDDMHKSMLMVKAWKRLKRSSWGKDHLHPSDDMLNIKTGCKISMPSSMALPTTASVCIGAMVRHASASGKRNASIATMRIIGRVSMTSSGIGESREASA
mmetsp:Transcript_51964/g.121678  ORF Transcript_51964/g.121678 Transcript_51964/m.121678 type:complete len:205 (+) Transcript_51964:225-839(+)